MINFKPGTRIELDGFPAFPGFPGVAPRQARIGRWVRSVMGPRSRAPAGYHPVRFADGACLMVHESGFRVIDGE
jgi:hypothetical protein